MFDAIFKAIEVWMRTLLTKLVTSNLQNMFTDVNEKTGEIATQVGQTPQGWNSGIFNMIHNLSNCISIFSPPFNSLFFSQRSLTLPVSTGAHLRGSPYSG